MKKVKLFLDYKCFPLWIYGENGELIDNGLPEELSNDKELDKLLVTLQEEYNGLFVDSAVKFRYKGFENERDKELFSVKINNIISEIELKLGNKYVVENAIET